MTGFKNRSALFFAEESGAVTVDWVVLTAGIVGIGLSTMALVSAGVEDLSGDVRTQTASIDPGTMYDWATGAMANSGWGNLAIYSDDQTAQGAEEYAAWVLEEHNGDWQAAYDQLYQQAMNMTYSGGESIDDFGAFEALAAANGITLETGTNMSYAELHAAYAENPW